MYLNVNNLYECPMSENLPVGGFKWEKDVSKIDEEFIKHYDENYDIGYFLKVHIQYLEELHYLHFDLPFLTQKMKINRHELVCTHNDKKVHCSHKEHKTGIKYLIKLSVSVLYRYR